MKKALVFIVLITLLAGGFYAWKNQSAKGNEVSQKQAAAAPVPEVGIVTVHPESVSFTKDLPGRTSSFRISEIRPQVSGIVQKRLFEEGANVEEGQQLYQIDPATYQAAYNRSKADLMKAEASLRASQSKFRRNEELVNVGAISKQGFEDTKAALDQARADVEIAKAALATSKINLDYTKVHSPISGRIGKSLVTEGALVTANQTSSLASVQQVDPIYVDVTQSSGELMELRRQSETSVKVPVTLLLDGDTRKYEHMGEVQFSDITVDQTTGSVQVRILFPNPKGELLPGLFVRARIEQARTDNALLIPQKAASRDASGDIVVWIVGEGDKISQRKIKADQAIGDRWLVKEGIQAGDRVVVEGTQKVRAEAVVKPVEVTKLAAEHPAQKVEPSPAPVEPAASAEDETAVIEKSHEAPEGQNAGQ